jgi:hypothetical protein
MPYMKLVFLNLKSDLELVLEAMHQHSSYDGFQY